MRLQKDVSRQEAIEAMASGAGIVMIKDDDYSRLPTPLDVEGDGRVWVARARLPIGQMRSPWLQYWNVADNLLKGAATNAVQILKHLVAR